MGSGDPPRAAGHDRDQSDPRRQVTTRRRVLAAAAAAGVLVTTAAVIVALKPPGIENAGPFRHLSVPHGHAATSARPRMRARLQVPTPTAVRNARTFARQREGVVALAVARPGGWVAAEHGGRQFISASVVKALLLVAELDRLRRDSLPLDPETRDLLRAMITVSDNDAADSIYARVGDEGLLEVARRAGMRDFAVDGYWANAQITALDMVAFGLRLDRLLKGRHGEFANGLLSGITPEQRWGVPRAVGIRWRVRFKGGWRTTELGALAHQFARLDRDDGSLSLAVLTDGQPSHDYATQTIQGVAHRLLVEP